MSTAYTANQAFPKVFRRVKDKGHTINALKLLEIMRSEGQKKYIFTEADIEDLANNIIGPKKGTEG